MIILKRNKESNSKKIKNDNNVLSMRPGKAIDVPPLGQLEKSVAYLLYDGYYNCAGFILNEFLEMDQYANHLERCSIDNLYFVDLDVRFGGSKEWQTPFVISPSSARMSTLGGIFYKDNLIRVSRLSSEVLKTTNIQSVLENHGGSFKSFVVFGWMNWPREIFDEEMDDHWISHQISNLSFLDLGKSKMWDEIWRRS